MEIDPNAARPRTSTREHQELEQRLQKWLHARLGPDARVSGLSSPQGTGMSSETLLFDLAWREAGEEPSLRCVARLPPDANSVPLFPEYDLAKQFRVMQLVRERSEVPVPRMLWYEADATHLGAPFFIMERSSGETPSDVPPYVFDSWLLRADAADRLRLQEGAIEVLVKLHAIALADDDLALLRAKQSGETILRRHVASTRAFYDWVTADGLRSPLLERAFAWLEANWPVEEGPEVLSWGDARIGNMLFVDFAPTAVLDWEMSATGPREMDLGWMIYMHHFFQDFTTLVGTSGLPDMMRLDDAVAHYERLSGYRARDLAFYTLYAALRHGVVMFRIGRRQAHFGEKAIPADPDELIPHRGAIAAMLEGSYWNTRR